MSGQSGGFVNTTNLLVPPNAMTHCVKTAFTASASIVNINFQQFSLDNFSFNPQAAYFDNTAGEADLIVEVLGLGFTLSIPAGAMQAANFPSPANAQFNITGAGNVVVYWVDYPLTLTTPNGGNAGTVLIGGQPVSVQVVGGQVGVAGNNPVDKSIAATVSDASTLLLAANANRKTLLIAAPQGSGVWLNMAGGAAGVGATGCLFLPAGAIYESGITVNQNAIYYYCTVANETICVLEG
jgi:hypothetical protein